MIYKSGPAFAFPDLGFNRRAVPRPFLFRKGRTQHGDSLTLIGRLTLLVPIYIHFDFSVKHYFHFGNRPIFIVRPQRGLTMASNEFVFFGTYI